MGARVYVTPLEENTQTIVKEVRSVSAFCGQSELTVHVGLGAQPLQHNLLRQSEGGVAKKFPQIDRKA